MLVLLQVVSLTIISAVLAASTYAAWLGLAPEQDFLAFLGKGTTVLPLIGLLTVYGSSLAFIIGWKPNVALATWLRAKVVVPIFIRARWLLGIIGLFAAALAIVSTFIYSFSNKHNSEIIGAVLGENFDRADKLIASHQSSANYIADLYFFNESERQYYYRSTGNSDANLCRVYHTYFETRRHIFQPAWSRYTFHFSKGACLTVLDDPKNALAEYQRALKLARWLGGEEIRLASRRVAALYLRDSKGYSDIPDQVDRFKRVLALLATDPDTTAVRMRGAALYFLGEYSKATYEWERQYVLFHPTIILKRRSY